MSHMSALALFDHIAGTADLTTQETEHLQDCDDCRHLAVMLEDVLEDSSDIAGARRYLAEQGTLPLSSEPPKEVHEDQRELDETPG